MPCSVSLNIIDLNVTSLASWHALPILFDRGEQKNTVPKSGERWLLDGKGRDVQVDVPGEVEYLRKSWGGEQRNVNLGSCYRYKCLLGVTAMKCSTFLDKRSKISL